MWQKFVFAMVTISLAGPVMAAEAAKLHIVMVCDTKAEGISGGVKADQQALAAVLSEVFQSRMGRLGGHFVAREEQLTPSAVLAGISGLKVNSGLDSILFYYSGHGGWDPTKLRMGEEKGHYFAMSGGILHRSDVRDALLAKVPYAAFIISDCCSTLAEVRTATAAITPAARRTPAEWKGFQDLFFRHRGVVDIQAATRGEFGWSDSVNGGLFSRTLTRLLCEPRSEFHADKEDRLIRWEEEFFPKLKSATLSLFNEAKKNSRRRMDGQAEIADAEAQTPQMITYARWVPYKFIAECSGKCLDVAYGSQDAGGKVWQWPDNNTPAQFWLIEGPWDQGAQIISLRSGMCLDVTGGAKDDGVRVQQWPKNGTNAQRWQLVRIKDDVYKIVSSISGKCLDVDNRSTESGAKIQQWSDNGTSAQHARLVKVD